MAVKAIPDNYPRLVPIFVVKNGAKAIDFYTKVFGAKERMRMAGPDGSLTHCELAIGDSVIMFGEPWTGEPVATPQLRVCVYVEDCDAVMKRAIESGASLKSDAVNQFYGDRSGCVLDPYGVEWTISTHIEDVSADEMDRRMQQTMAANPRPAPSSEQRPRAHS